MNTIDFWDIHGLGFLLCLFFFPRITVWFFSAINGGFWFWLGFLFVPRIYIAVIACMCFWESNPILCVCALLTCVGGTAGGTASARRLAK